MKHEFVKRNGLFITILFLLLTFTSGYVNAKGGGSFSSSSGRSSFSGSSSRSSVSSTPSKPSSYTTTKSTYSNSSGANKSVPPSTSIPSVTVPKTFAQTQMSKSVIANKSTSSYNSYKYEKTKFTKGASYSSPVTSSFRTPTQRAIYSNNSVVSPAVYTQRRSTFYTSNHYTMPSYGYQSYQRFGIWDSMALWYMLDHIHDSQYSSMYYNHQNDSDMQKWRKEANRLAEGNVDLKNKLADLDKEVSELKGTPVDVKYVPKDMGSTALVPPDSGFPWFKFFMVILLITTLGIGTAFIIKRRNALKSRTSKSRSW